MTVKGLTKGDTIRCADKYEAVEYLMAVMEGGKMLTSCMKRTARKDCGLW